MSQKDIPTTMKPKVTKAEMFRVIKWYSERLAQDVLYKPLTPLVQHHVKVRLLELQGIMQARESHQAWHIPLEVSFDYNTNSILLDVAAPDSIDIID